MFISNKHLTKAIIMLVVFIFIACGESATNTPAPPPKEENPPPTNTTVAVENNEENTEENNTASNNTNTTGDNTMTKNEATANWKGNRGFGYTVLYPPDWEFKLVTSIGQGIQLFLPPGMSQQTEKQGTNIVIVLLPNAVDSLEAFQEEKISGLKDSDSITKLEYLDVSERTVGGEKAVELRYAVQTTAGSHVEGISVATINPKNNQPLEFTMGVFDIDGVEFSTLMPIFEEIVGSVEFKP